MLEDEEVKEFNQVVLIGGLNDILGDIVDIGHFNHHIQKLFNTLKDLQPKKTFLFGPQVCPEQENYTVARKALISRLRRCSQELGRMGLHITFHEFPEDVFSHDLHFTERDTVHLNQEGTKHLINFINNETHLALETLKTTSNNKGQNGTRYGCGPCADRLHKARGCKETYDGTETLDWLDGIAKQRSSDENLQPPSSTATSHKLATESAPQDQLPIPKKLATSTVKLPVKPDVELPETMTVTNNEPSNLSALPQPPTPGMPAAESEIYNNQGKESSTWDEHDQRASPSLPWGVDTFSQDSMQNGNPRESTPMGGPEVVGAFKETEETSEVGDRSLADEHWKKYRLRVSRGQAQVSCKEVRVL
jgi:hypothetical protein